MSAFNIISYVIGGAFWFSMFLAWFHHKISYKHWNLGFDAAKNIYVPEIDKYKEMILLEQQEHRKTIETTTTFIKSVNKHPRSN